MPLPKLHAIVGNAEQVINPNTHTQTPPMWDNCCM